MARTNPHHDWPEQQSASPRSNGAEWESLRNELVALLDQVEDHVAASTPHAVEPAAVVPKPAAQPTRHNEALKSVRQAVSRLADRSGEERPAMPESVVDAINQIRARQGAAPATRAPAAPADEPADIAEEPQVEAESEPQPAVESTPAGSEPLAAKGLAKSLDALGERIGQFEAEIGAKFETLDNRADISGQIAQLSETIEMLATAVGETGHFRRMEAQIGNLAELLVSDRRADADTTAQRIEHLTSAVDKLVTHQTETTGKAMDQTVHAQERQANSMELIERSVRSIYDRIDALEAAQAEPAYVERLSHDMAALTEAVSTQREPQSLLDKIDALSSRISTVEAPNQVEADTLAQSVSALRDIIAETIVPRFDAIDTRMETLAAPVEPTDSSAIETQLRAIARRVEETSAQLKALSATPETNAPATDFDLLAERIVERANALAPRVTGDEEGIDKADLAALEERLATLFASTATDTGDTASHFEGVKSSINQVGNRIARLEDMLNGRDAPAEAAIVAEPAAEPVKATGRARPRKAPDDAMPADPATGTVRPVLNHVETTPETETEAVAATVAAAPMALEPAPVAHEAEPAPKETPSNFALDPEAIERPAKPQSSFAAGRANPFDQSIRTPDPETAVAGVSSASRSSFIEAARRSARQPDIEDGEPKSLIGRALMRFQRQEAQDDVAVDDPRPAPRLEDTVSEQVTVERENEVEAHDDTETKAGFLARNRRALLLGTALVVAIALAVPLFLDRAAPAPQLAPDVGQTATPAPIDPEPETVAPDVIPIEPEAAPIEPARDTATPEASVDETPVGDTSVVEPVESPTSDVRVIEQQPSVSAARVDASTLSGDPMLDPIRTAAIPSGETAADPAPDAMTAAAMPPISVPEDIEPEALRLAAEGGDEYAQFEVGAILTEGTIVEQDFEQAAAWYERSAAQGFVPAQYRLGSLFESGRGVDRDLEMSRLWYERAAEAGNRMSMHNLASLYAGGELETQDFAAAARWFEEAASRGLTDSQFNLGMLYARGLGVEQDFEQSYIWFSLAARAGDEDAATARDDVARSLDSATVQSLDDTIAAWTPAEFDLAANFAPIGTWNEAFDPGPEITNSDVIVQVQMLLSKLGYDIGTADGIVGPKTREAIASFEAATGMSESGAINPRLLAVLGSQPV